MSNLIYKAEIKDVRNKKSNNDDNLKVDKNKESDKQEIKYSKKIFEDTNTSSNLLNLD